MNLIVLLLIIILLAGAFPAYPYNRDWGYGPVGLIVLILVILLLAGRIH